MCQLMMSYISPACLSALSESASQTAWSLPMEASSGPTTLQPGQPALIPLIPSITTRSIHCCLVPSKKSRLGSFHRPQCVILPL